METKFTPGPWAVFGERGVHVQQQDAGCWGLIVADCSALDDGMAQANAHLIAASPEMFEALTELRELLNLRDPWDNTAVDRWNAASAKAEAAISKAQGTHS